jgi:hypothetical protein
MDLRGAVSQSRPSPSGQDRDRKGLGEAPSVNDLVTLDELCYWARLVPRQLGRRIRREAPLRPRRELIRADRSAGDARPVLGLPHGPID